MEGHGIHLSANSIGNVTPSPTAHLWDESVGHHLWSTGVVLVVLAVARATHDRPAPAPAAYLLTVLVGVTFFTNSVDGSMAVFGLVATAFLTLVGWTHREGFGRMILATYGLALVLLIGFGLWQGGYPEFTDLGWA